MPPRKPAPDAQRAQKRAQAEARAKRNMQAILLFVLGLLLLLLALIPGGNVWNVAHNFVLGVFGLTAFLVPVLLGYAAVQMARKNKSVGGKLVQVLLLTLLIGGLLNVIFVGDGNLNDLNYGEYLSHLYTTQRWVGGLLSGLLSYPLHSLLHRAGAIIVLILAIFIFTMLTTGMGLWELLKTIARPFKRIFDRVGEGYIEKNADEYDDEDLDERVEKPKKVQPKFNVDVSLGETPATKEVKPQPEEKPIVPILQEKSYSETLASAPPISAPSNESEMADKQKNITDAYKAITGGEIPQDMEKYLQNKQNFEELPKAESLPKPVKTVESEKIDTNPFASKEEVKTDGYNFPPVSLLNETRQSVNTANVQAELDATGEKLVDVLKSFGVQTRVIATSRGPSVTRYELQPAAGVKINKITNLSDDIALNLASAGVRIEAPIPGKPAVGIEVPNTKTDIIGIRELINSPTFSSNKSRLSVVLGKDITGAITVADIAKMPHLLIAGATGSGKSVCVNSMIVSMIYKASPADVKFLMIDPKQVELGIYNGIPHMIVPVVTDPRKAAGALGWAVTEMLRRYKLFSDNGARNIEGYALLAKKNKDFEHLPQIVIIIDELADLMMVAPGEVEDSICRLAQMARAAGMHLVIATQRPSVDVITGIIKANIPSRIALTVASQVDSRTILDMGGAEKLLGRGDMLYYPVGAPKPQRVQGCYVTDDEIEDVVNFVKKSATSEYDEGVMQEIERQAVEPKGNKGVKNDGDDSQTDVLFEAAVDVVLEGSTAATSMLQRRLKLGYGRAARIIDDMAARGIVGPPEGSKPRKVLISPAQWMEMKALDSSSAQNGEVEEEI